VLPITPKIVINKVVNHFHKNARVCRQLAYSGSWQQPKVRLHLFSASGFYANLWDCTNIAWAKWHHWKTPKQ